MCGIARGPSENSGTSGRGHGSSQFGISLQKIQAQLSNTPRFSGREPNIERIQRCYGLVQGLRSSSLIMARITMHFPTLKPKRVQESGPKVRMLIMNPGLQGHISIITPGSNELKDLRTRDALLH